MYNPGWSATEKAAYEAQLVTNHWMRTRAMILDLDHNPVQDITKYIQDGQTNIDATQQISRTATNDLYDPTRVIGLDTANAGEGSVSPKYLLQKFHGVFVESLNRWIDIPIFTGLIDAPTRDGDLLKISASGKEVLALDKAWTVLTVKKGTKKTDAIRQILAAAGESKFRISSSTSTLGADVSVTRDDTFWDIAKGIADGLGWNMFYDAMGTLVLRPKSTTVVWNFSTGNGGSIRSDWQTGFSTEGIYNIVLATGGTPSGKKDPITAYAIAPSSSALNPTNLGRNGVKRYLRYDIAKDTLTKQADVQALADKTLPQVLLDSVSISFESMPVPHLEELDAIKVTDNATGISTSATQRTWAIGDNSAATQPNGFLKRVSRSTRKLKKTV